MPEFVEGQTVTFSLAKDISAIVIANKNGGGDSVQVAWIHEGRRITEWVRPFEIEPIERGTPHA